MVTQNDLQKIPEFVCKYCDYTSSDRSNYNRHFTTVKHKMMTNGDETTTKRPHITNFKCDCGKIYKYRQGFHRHKKTCIERTNNDTITTCDKTDYKTLFLQSIARNDDLMNMLVTQNQDNKEFINLLHEQSRTIQEIIPKIGNTFTTNNTKFNLNVFLNEDCKDAINFSDFIKSIQVSVEDLENQSQLGYVNGITKLFLDNIRKLSINKRPVHCTDKKRNTLYVKEDDEWSKEGSHDTLKKGIQEITSKTHGTLIQMKRDNAEEYADGDSDFSNKCISIQRNLTPSYPRETSIGKIVGNISDNTILTKPEEENQRKLI